MTEKDNKIMQRLITEAKRAREHGEYAISSAVADRDGRIIALGVNHVKTDADPSSHAEIVALRMAVRVLGTRYLYGHTLYTTHFPCPMCITCALWAGVDGVVYGAEQEDIIEYGKKYGNDKFKWRGVIFDYKNLVKQINPKFTVEQCSREECCGLFHNE